MTTLQEQFERDFPDKEVKEIYRDAYEKYLNSNFTNYDLDLGKYVNLENLNLGHNKITSVNLSECKELRILDLSYNNLTSIDLTNQKELEILILHNNKLISVDFLNQLPNPKKLEELYIYNNVIQPTDIKTFDKFLSLTSLHIGTTETDTELKKGKRNKFYGSLKSYKNLTKLEAICIEATDVNEGLEYLPFSLVKSSTELGGGYGRIQCSPNETNTKVKTIQDQLRPFNYDIEAWQLAHPHLIYEAKPEIFFDLELKSKWLTVLRDKTNKIQQKLIETKEQEPSAIKRIKRLEMKLKNLKLIQDNISNHALIDRLQSKKEMVNKTTQTDLISEEIQKQVIAKK